MPKVTLIPAAKEQFPRQKRVAAYARVSVDSEELMHSLSAQVSHYNSLIQRTPEWVFAGVYVDEGISGTSMTIRRGFQQMLADCEAGKIDIILTKSVSRFARNTVDLLSTVRRLRELGIEVRFEREHISTLTGDGELMLSILASFAEEESVSISRNVKWAFQRKYLRGQPHARQRRMGYRWEGDEMVIVPEEAEVIRYIFSTFLEGKSYRAIARELDAMGVKTFFQKEHFSHRIVRQMLQAEEYAGTLVLQKEFNIRPKKRVDNKGELPMYKIDDHHEAIIDQATFDRVQLEIQSRAAARKASRNNS